MMKDLNEYTDAEELMPLPTSDYQRLIVCMVQQKHTLPNNNGTNEVKRCIAASSVATFVGTKADVSQAASVADKNYALATPIDPVLSANHFAHTERLAGNEQNRTNCSNNTDLASLNSSDTYASCQTHPFLSQGDLTGEMVDISCTLAEFDVDDTYFATLDTDQPSRMTRPPLPLVRTQVKKSASGDASLHSFSAPVPIAECSRAIETLRMNYCSGSRASLNDPIIPKHQKMRFQQRSLNKARALDMITQSALPKKAQPESVDVVPIPSLYNVRKTLRSSLISTKGIASATKLINHHIFGKQHSRGKVL